MPPADFGGLAEIFEEEPKLRREPEIADGRAVADLLFDRVGRLPSLGEPGCGDTRPAEFFLKPRAHLERLYARFRERHRPD